MKKSIIFSLILLLPLSILGEVKQADSEDNPLSLFSVELSLGKNWDTTKEAHLQTGFQEHVANLKKLRDEGILIIGARYGDLGLLIFKAKSIEEVNEMIQVDPMIADTLFSADVQKFNAFYNGCTKLE